MSVSSGPEVSTFWKTDISRYRLQQDRQGFLDECGRVRHEQTIQERCHGHGPFNTTLNQVINL